MPLLVGGWSLTIAVCGLAIVGLKVALDTVRDQLRAAQDRVRYLTEQNADLRCGRHLARHDLRLGTWRVQTDGAGGLQVESLGE